MLDVFAGARTPAHLTSVELYAEVARVLAPGGCLAANVADGPGLAFARGSGGDGGLGVRGTSRRSPSPAIWRGRRFGNLVLVGVGATAARRPPWPAAAPATRCRRGCVAGADLARWAAGAAVVTDATAVDSPEPPREVFGRR